MNWILNLIGIAIYFLNRFAQRRIKLKPTFTFWIKDNWPELTMVLLFDLGCMLILMNEATQVKITELFANYIPLLEANQVLAKLILSFSLGLGLSSLIYSIFRKKLKSKK